jgi:hypothetical protein
MTGDRIGGWIVAVVAVVLVTTLAGCIQSGPDDGDGAHEDGVTLVIDFEGYDPDTMPGRVATWSPNGRGEWVLVSEETDGDTMYTVNNVTGTTVLDVLLAAAEVGGFIVDHRIEGMGAFVEAIDGLENGRDDHHWSYYVNGEYGSVASDRAVVEDGDTVRWVFMGNPFG